MFWTSPRHVLVAYASRNGSTAEIARAIGNELGLLGIECDVKSVGEVEDIRRYNAVIIGSAIYGWRWEKSAVQFAKANAVSLRTKAVWLFSSGPLNWSAHGGQVRQVRSARKISDLTGARGHMTFGGKLPGNTKGIIMKQATKNSETGDYRDFDSIRAWANELGTKIAVIANRPRAAAPR